MGAALKCLACGTDNKPGEDSCAACSSSLNLKLCSACEGINASAATRCHSCGAEFADEAPAAPPPAEGPVRRAEASAAETPKVEPWVEVAMVEEVPRPRWLPARRYIVPPPVRSRIAQATVIWTVAIGLGLGASYAYHQYHVSGWATVSGLISAKVAPTPILNVTAAPEIKVQADLPPAPTPKAVPVSPKTAKGPAAQPTPAASIASAPVAEPKPKAAPVAPKTAKAALQATPAPEPARAVAPLTHTRGGSTHAETSGPPRPSITAGTAAPTAVVPAASAAARARVTHTREPEPGEAAAAAVAVSAPAALTQPPIEKPMNPNPSACAPAVAALGLCLAK